MPHPRRQEQDTGDAATRPPIADIEQFLVVLHKLERFEATMRIIRGMGALAAGECPDPAAVRVVAWLKDLCAQGIDSPVTTHHSTR